MGRTKEIVDLTLDEIISELENKRDDSYDENFIFGIDTAIDIIESHKESR